MTLPSFRLDGRVALVTGASQGLGQSAALALAEAGADIAVIDYAEATETVTQVEALGRRAHSIRLDLVQATADDLEAAVAEVVMTLGRIDVLVNNAGIIRRAPVLEHSAKDWDDVLAINLDAVFHLSQRVGHRFVAQGSGKIINIASMLSFQGGVFVPGYAASKHAVAGITKSFANELAVHGVCVNAIAPGYMATENTAPIRADAARERSILDRIPAGRWGTPDDLAGPFVFLASSASDYLNGAIIPVDGGWLVR
ncbi:2-dehydro-3-deoxy-D-gluconate 5-dehydrogenase KduD [Sanguibacter inulinus]|jgi:2-deoxy-D-gluconate 3-dehydrogenase|uniref:2-dehydro-3-deoxy-D-gluconate 5-dehydrogenase KduD n=1 Tax=Sanguibacter inulinus TaxID=60922 RepID=A0A853EUG8_9MICO|nr:2-dehydro-3-deoxy-D-gluconate 5-dehydrogenase KduD [Sanguibacter inulinus]MBF0722259.1 2-dehydro-3-deoxy-D-gluconate 5-dehydrogenase KduD [Sanguibacter inulinus]NYS93404.1 2-dehydro-3-deoxy-D-gluconate 5-dehydrogenase KduD [Sanguibacter inulinus]